MRVIYGCVVLSQMCFGTDKLWLTNNPRKETLGGFATGPGCWSGEDPLQSIKRAMPSGCTLLGVPHHSRCLVPSRIVRALLREPPAQDVLQTRSPDAAFALRVRVTAFPEHAYSCWVMLAVRTAEPIAALPTAITSQ